MKKIILCFTAAVGLTAVIISCNKKSQQEITPQKANSYEFFLADFKAHSHNYMQALLHKTGGLKRSAGKPENSYNPVDSSGMAHNKILDYIGQYLTTINDSTTTLYLPVINGDGDTISYSCSTRKNKMLYYSQTYLNIKNPGNMQKIGVFTAYSNTYNRLKDYSMSQNLSFLQTNGIIDSKVADLIDAYYAEVEGVTDVEAVIDYSIDYENSIVDADSTELSSSEKILALQYVTIYKYSMAYWSNTSNPWGDVNETMVGGPGNNWDALGTCLGYSWCVQNTGPGGYFNNDICVCLGNPYCVSNTTGATLSAVMASVL